MVFTLLGFGEKLKGELQLSVLLEKLEEPAIFCHTQATAGDYFIGEF
jgi:hypothetical protein